MLFRSDEIYSAVLIDAKYGFVDQHHCRTAEGACSDRIVGAERLIEYPALPRAVALHCYFAITLALQAERGSLRRIRPSRQRELALSWVDALDIRPPDVDRAAGTLSGGNQQKVLLARMLALSPRLLVLDEPTRGIDVGAKVEVQNLIGELADNGLSVMFISAELEEVLRIGNRVAIVQGGRIVDTVPSDELTVDSLTAMVASPDGVA